MSYIKFWPKPVYIRPWNFEKYLEDEDTDQTEETMKDKGSAEETMRATGSPATTTDRPLYSQQLGMQTRSKAPK